MVKYNIQKIIITLFIFSLFGNPALLKPATNGSIEGTIVDADTKEPLPGANIIVQGTMLGTMSDLQGFFILPKIPVGQYKIKATMMGYKNDVRTVTIALQQATKLNFELKETVIETPALVVTAGKKAQSFQDVSNSVSLVTFEEIERKNRAFLDEVLEYTPGVDIINGDVNIRGSSGFTLGAGSRVLLLIDGIPMMPGDSGDIKWDAIPLSQISRVEVVKGAGSALYGSHALGGVINIISKEPTSTPLTEIKFSSGIYDDPYYSEWEWTDRLQHFNQTDITHSRRLGKVGIIISGGRKESTGYQQNGEFIKWNILGRVDVPFTTQKKLTIQSNYMTGESGDILSWRNQNDVLEMPITSVGDWSNTNKFSLNSVYYHLINQKFTYKVRASYFRSYWKNFYHDNDDFSNAQKFGCEIQADYLLNGSHSLTFGSEGIYDITKSAMFGNHDGSNWAMFMQDEIHLGKYVTSTLGLRYDYHHVDTGVSDNQFNPKFGLAIKPSLITTIRASVGRGFRSPTMAEMFTQTTTSGFRVIPNPDLKAERAWSYEIGINQILSEHLLLDVAAFNNDYWNFIEPEPDDQNIVQFINVDRARIRGLEFLLQSGFWKKRITSSVSYTILDPEDVSTGKTLAYRPKHLLTCSFGFAKGVFETGVDFRYVSRLDSVKVYPTEDRVDQKVFDAHISLNFNNTSIAANINNIFNYSYTQVERNLAPVRNYVLTFSMKF